MVYQWEAVRYWEVVYQWEAVRYWEVVYQWEAVRYWEVVYQWEAVRYWEVVYQWEAVRYWEAVRWWEARDSQVDGRSRCLDNAHGGFSPRCRSCPGSCRQGGYGRRRRPDRSDRFGPRADPGMCTSR